MLKEDLVLDAIYVMDKHPKLRRVVEIKDTTLVYDIHDDGTDDLFEVPLSEFLPYVATRLE